MSASFDTVWTNRESFPGKPVTAFTHGTDAEALTPRLPLARYHFEDENGQHAHFLGDSPLIGTSSVTKILAKPLTWWASGLAVQAFGCPDPKVITKIKNGKATKAEIKTHRESLDKALSIIQDDSFTLDKFCDLIDKAYRAHTVKLADSAQAGTDLHAELERFVKWRMAGSPENFSPFAERIHPFIDWANDNVKRFLWAEGHTYSEKYWLGGISDTGYEGFDGEFGILDFKSSKEAYPDHFFQIGGYNVSIDETGICDAQGNHIYTPEKPITKHGVVPFGAKVVEPKFSESPATDRKAFLNLLEVYKVLPKNEF